MPDRDRGLIGPSGRQLGYAVGIFLLIVLTGLTTPDQRGAGSGEPQQASAGQEQPARQPAPIFSSGDNGSRNTGQARQEQTQDQSVGPVRWLIRAALDPDNFANFLIMLFTLALTVVGILEFLLLRRSTEESAIAVEIARRTAEATNSVASGTVATGAATLALANAAERSAKTAAEANAITRAMGEGQLRPWVDVEIVRVSMASTTLAFCLSADVRLSNLGKSPALNIQSRARIMTSLGAAGYLMGDFFPDEEKLPHVHNLLPGGAAEKPLHPRVDVKNIAMVTIKSGGKTVIGPQFVPILRVSVEYQWGSPVRHGKTVKNFAVSAVRKYDRPGERVANPVRLGEMPVTKLTAFEIDVAEVT